MKLRSKQRADAGEIEDLRRYVTRNFAWTEWYPFVDEISIVDGHATARLSPHVVPDEAKAIAVLVCAALSGWVWDRRTRRHAGKVRVVGSDGGLLVLRRRLSDPCR